MCGALLIVLLSILASACGDSGCPRDTFFDPASMTCQPIVCTKDSDCPGSDMRCSQALSGGHCYQPDHGDPGCFRNADCCGGFCDQGRTGGCVSCLESPSEPRCADVAPAREDDEGFCRATCETAADCSSQLEFCRPDDKLCVEIEACSRGELTGFGDELGPVLFEGAQLVPTEPDTPRCEKSPAACINNGNVCRFGVRWFDPDGDLPDTRREIYHHAEELDEAGSASRTYDAYVDPTVGPETIVFEACLDEVLASFVVAFRIRDLADHTSNTVCVSGEP